MKPFPVLANLLALLLFTSGCVGENEVYDEDLPIFEGCAQSPAHPFGSHHQSYVSDATLPQVDQEVMDQAVRDFYDEWKGDYLLNGAPCEAGTYYINSGMSDKITVSEAHGYGMLITAYMAGHDPQARTIFDGMYRFFRNHPSSFSSDLLSWAQDMECQDAQGTNSATDGDLDIAYALLLADKQWGSAGAINYRKEARKILRAIMEHEVNATSQYLLIGDWAIQSPEHYSATRPSDFMPGHLDAFHADDVTGLGGDFSKVRNSTYNTFREARNDTTGLISDFVLDPVTNPRPAEEGFLEWTDYAYGYNSCRVPWRIGVHYLTSGSTDAKEFLTKLLTWLRQTTGGDPTRISAGYYLNGNPLRDYDDMSYTAPFAVGATADPANQDFLNGLWDYMATPSDWGGYYSDSIQLMSMIALSGNWWTPQNATCVD